MAPVIYHNPDCGTSRNTLALLRAFGPEPEIIPYLERPPARDRLLQLWKAAGLTIQDGLRRRGTPFGELGLDRPERTDDERLDAVARYPILINRPLVVTDKGVRLCRPADIALDLVETSADQALTKEEGAPFVRDRVIAPDGPFREALANAGLPVEDLDEPDRIFFDYRDLAGKLVGYGGFELYASDVLIRSVVVLDEARGKGIGRNLLLLLLHRAFDQGARQAYVLTTTAGDYLRNQHFEDLPRERAPNSILASAQAMHLCPADAVLLKRRIEL